MEKGIEEGVYSTRTKVMVAYQCIIVMVFVDLEDSSRGETEQVLQSPLVGNSVRFLLIVLFIWRHFVWTGGIS
jgi:hypothetical protein